MKATFTAMMTTGSLKSRGLARQPRKGLSVLLLLALMAWSAKGGAAEGWTQYPADLSAPDYAGDALAAAWDRLHSADLEPFPSPQNLRDLLERNPAIGASIPDFEGDYQQLSARLQQGWVHYHNGDFEQAYRIGSQLGWAGAYLAHRARAIHGYYLAPPKTRAERFGRQMEELSDGLANTDFSYPNLYYILAYVSGRYSQEISIATALRKGMASRVRDNLERVLDARPAHAEANAAYGAWHAEVVSQVGGFLANLTYGASAAQARERCDRAIAEAPGFSPLYTACAQNLLALNQQGDRAQAIELLRKGLSQSADDAAERLDHRRARRLLDELTADDEG